MERITDSKMLSYHFYCTFFLVFVSYHVGVSQHLVADSSLISINYNEILKSGNCQVLNRICGNISGDLDALECAYSYKVR